MSEKPQVHVANGVGRVGAKFSALDGFNALTQIVDVTRECIKVTQSESTQRTRIRAYEKTEVARIKAAEAVLKDYFEQVFAERRATFEALFTRLDQALEAGNGEALNAVVRGIVDIARTSPLADLGDLGQIRAALDDPDQVWDL
ncbi:hypothetical protein [Mycolicibacter kumamotonensis]|uniref:hypothetical protein n=1 Tax=Mycolicibacter kumamotonensis TaxID=354243 RepID=UPI001F178FCC|nr:hypothetical protein [Mycolicibacter kumamotonensis]